MRTPRLVDLPVGGTPPTGGPSGRLGPPAGRRLRVAWPALLPALILLLSIQALPATASEEETEEGRLLVVQSISLIANGADLASIEERVDDAVRAPDPTGVDLPKVREALALLGQDSAGPAQLSQVRALLESAVTVRAATGYGDLPAPGEVGTAPPFTTGAATGTTVVLDPLVPTRGVDGAGDVVLLGLGAVSAGLGVYLARRWRPHHSVRELRAARPAVSS